MTNQKGQGSLEYLLIIGGGILVAVIIIGAIISLAGTGTGGSKANLASQTCHTYLTQSACEAATDAQIGAATSNSNCAAPFESTGTTGCCWDVNASAGLRCDANPLNTYS